MVSKKKKIDYIKNLNQHLATIKKTKIKNCYNHSFFIRKV